MPLSLVLPLAWCRWNDMQVPCPRQSLRNTLADHNAEYGFHCLIAPVPDIVCNSTQPMGVSSVVQTVMSLHKAGYQSMYAMRGANPSTRSCNSHIATFVDPGPAAVDIRTVLTALQDKGGGSSGSAASASTATSSGSGSGSSSTGSDSDSSRRSSNSSSVELPS